MYPRWLRTLYWLSLTHVGLLYILAGLYMAVIAYKIVQVIREA